MCIRDRIEAMDGRALDQWGVAIKLYPSCSYTHRLADCAVALSKRCEAGDIDEIHAELPDFHYAILRHDRPDTEIQARFSLPFVMAVCLVHGRLTGKHLADPRAAGEDIWRLIERTNIRQVVPRRPDMNFDPEQPDRLRVRLISGEVIEESCAFPKGSPNVPVSRATILAKFAENAAPLRVHPDLQSWAGSPDLAAFIESVTA